MALKTEEYYDLQNFTDANNHFIRVATEIGEQAVQKALESVNLKPTDIDAIFFVSVTGIATPSIDAKLVNKMGMRPDVKRIPIFGLGCVAGAAGLARVHDYLKAYPDQIAVLLSVELCSLTLQHKDLSIANLISSGLFGDGAACVIGIGTDRAKKMSLTGKPSVVATKSRFYPDTEDVMGWDIGAEGFKIVLQARVPQMARAHVREDMDAFLAERNLQRKDISTWICHTGGPKVISAFQQALEISDEAVSLTRKSLQEVGNLSSASVLYVLADSIEKQHQTEEYGVLMAMGPGFCCEMVLLQW